MFTDRNSFIACKHPPQKEAITTPMQRGRKRGLGLLFPFEARSFCSQLHVYAKRTVEEMDIFSLFETNNFSLLMSNSFLTALPYINPLHTSKN